jgi:NAD(P)-dependent dehydrogenase (short-subunit alcohol dehydrogenase family)
MSKMLVVGATSDVGLALIPRLLREGHDVIGIGRDASRLAAFNDQARFTPVVGDLTAERLGEAVAAAGDEGVDAVVHLVGSIALRPPHAMSVEAFEEVISTNLTSAFLTLSTLGKAMMRSGGGRMVFVSSVAASLGLANHEAIAAAKGGLEAMVRSAAATYARRGLRINAVAPSLTDTRMAAPLLRTDAAREASEQMVPTGQLNTAADVAEAVRWLLLDAPDGITGEVIHLDGGMGRLRASG